MVQRVGKSLQLNGDDTTIGKLKDAVVYRFAVPRPGLFLSAFVSARQSSRLSFHFGILQFQTLRYLIFN